MQSRIKRAIVLLMFLLLVISSVIFHDSKNENRDKIISQENTGSKQEVQQEKDKYPDFLIEKEWIYENMICTEYLYFGEDGSFSYYEACGNPVGNYDLYEQYGYNENTKSIELYPIDEEVEQTSFEVLRYDKFSLLLKTEEGIKEFVFDNPITIVNEEYVEYFEDYSAFLAILERTENGFITGPSNYDGDVPSQKELLREEKSAEDIKYFEMDIKTTITDEEEKSEFSYHEMTEEEIELILDSTLGIGFVWYNDEYEIEKIVFYGELIIWE